MARCYLCSEELIWGGDHDIDDDDAYFIVSNLSCPECGAFHLVYHPAPEGWDPSQTDETQPCPMS